VTGRDGMLFSHPSSVSISALSQMVEDQNGGVVLDGGDSYSVGTLDTLYKLTHGGQDPVWNKMEQKMQSGKNVPTAFLVPYNVVNSS
jgi:hypothetical protein